MNLKPYTIEAFKSGEVAITRNGIQVKDIHYFEALLEGCRLIGVLNGIIHEWHPDGNFYHGGDHPYDLFIKPKTKMIYQNLYWSETRNTFFLGNPHSEENHAPGIDYGDSKFVQTLSRKVTI